MKKSMLYGSLLSILSTTACADLIDQAAREDASNAVQLAANFSPNQLADASNSQPPLTPPTPAASTNQKTISPTTLPPSSQPTTSPATTQSIAPSVTQPINCNYHIPAQTTKVDETTILAWAEKATQQSFQFDYKNFTQQLALLKACYTEKGWQGFNDALQKSGNDKAIQTQSLTVSSTIDSKPTITTVQDNQWKVSIPLQVVYKNDKEKLTQLLTVDLVITRKISGDLGIVQMIASPRQATTKQP